MKKIGIVGCMGRIGKTLIHQVITSEHCVLAGGTVHQESAYIGKDIGEEAGLAHLGMTITSDDAGLFQEADVVIDFTTPEGTGHHLKLAHDFKTPLVIGTTGLNDLHKRLIGDVATAVPVLVDSNMSLGITLLKILTEQVAGILGRGFDIDVLEMHHRHKVDAPSGTGYDLGKAAAKGRGVQFEKVVTLDRTAQRKKREMDEIGFAVMRGGNVVGDHGVYFASDTEVISLNHRALSREIYAEGAIKGALWLLNKKTPSVYHMKDVLGLS